MAPTDLPIVADRAAVLTHPAFNRPPVHNERRRGRKKGTLSLDKARSERDAANVQFLRTAGQLDERCDGFAEGADKAIADRREPPATTRSRCERAVIDAALAILEAGLAQPGGVLNGPGQVKEFLQLQLAGRDREAFGVLFLDATRAVIAFEVLFEGTLTHTAVHPRVVAQRALALNAAAVVLSHNHPSGRSEPSRADELITHAVRQALSLLDIRVIDHIIVGHRETMSFAERGLL